VLGRLESLFYYRGRLYFYQEMRDCQSGYSYPGTGGAPVLGKELPQRASNCISLLWFVINYVDTQSNYVHQGTSGSFNSGLNIPQSLSCLLPQISSADNLFVCIPSTLA
jgi:hypothetical protein